MKYHELLIECKCLQNGDKNAKSLSFESAQAKNCRKHTTPATSTASAARQHVGIVIRRKQGNQSISISDLCHNEI